jgi:hypothetical protein
VLPYYGGETTELVTVPDFRLPAVQLSGLNTAVYWLREHGVKAKRLAELLNTNVGHIRVLKHRGKRPLLFAPPESLKSIIDRPTEDLRKRLHVRLEKDSVGHSGRERKRIEGLGAQIESIWTEYGQSGEFMAGLLALQGYGVEYGRPASAHWFRFMARLHQIRAWFRVHSGMSTSAYQEGKIAIDLSHLAYKEKEDPLDLRRLTESCLIASNACLLAANPKASLKLLDIATLGASNKDRNVSTARFHGESHQSNLNSGDFTSAGFPGQWEGGDLDKRPRRSLGRRNWTAAYSGFSGSAWHR